MRGEKCPQGTKALQHGGFRGLSQSTEATTKKLKHAETPNLPVLSYPSTLNAGPKHWVLEQVSALLNLHVQAR